MTPTFRTFLEDIDLLDPLDYAPRDADETIERLQASLDEKVSWKKLPVTFPQKGFEVHYRRRPRDFDVALVDTRSGVGRSSKPRIAVNVNMERKHAKLLTADGGQNVLYGMQTQVLSGADGYRGLGLAPLLYRTLVEHGQVLFSSTEQTGGGQKTWRRLTQSVGDVADVGVIVPGGQADRREGC